MKLSLKRLCSTRRLLPLMWRSLKWICDACEKLASCLCVDWVAMMPGVFGPRSLQAHGEMAAIDRMELHEAGPGLVEQDVVAEVADCFQDQLGVIDRAVVRALLDDRDAEGRSAPRLPGVGHQRDWRGFFRGSPSRRSAS